MSKLDQAASLSPHNNNNSSNSHCSHNVPNTVLHKPPQAPWEVGNHIFVISEKGHLAQRG